MNDDRIDLDEIRASIGVDVLAGFHRDGVDIHKETAPKISKPNIFLDHPLAA